MKRNKCYWGKIYSVDKIDSLGIQLIKNQQDRHVPIGGSHTIIKQVKLHYRGGPVNNGIHTALIKQLVTRCIIIAVNLTRNT